MKIKNSGNNLVENKLKEGLKMKLDYNKVISQKLDIYEENEYKKLKENYKARNPNTNQLIYKPERVRLKFKASNTLKKLINK